MTLNLTEVELQKLPGIKDKRVRAAFVTSATGFMHALIDYRAATTARDQGSINVWKDDKGLWHCEVHRFRQTIEAKTFTKKRRVKNWLYDWLPKIGTP